MCISSIGSGLTFACSSAPKRASSAMTNRVAVASYSRVSVNMAEQEQATYNSHISSQAGGSYCIDQFDQ